MNTHVYDNASRLISVTLGLTTTLFASNADGAHREEVVVFARWQAMV